MLDIDFWVLDVVRYQHLRSSEMTIMDKPEKLFLTVVRDMKHPKTPPNMLLYMMVPAAAYPSSYMLPQAYPDQLHAPSQPPTQSLAPSNPPPVVLPPAPSTHALPSPVSFPEIAPWLLSLNEHTHHCSPHINFSSLSEPLLKNRFFCINQLASKFVSVDKLMELLQMNYGTVILLLQYAKEDVEVCWAGKI